MRVVIAVLVMLAVSGCTGIQSVGFDAGASIIRAISDDSGLTDSLTTAMKNGNSGPVTINPPITPLPPFSGFRDIDVCEIAISDGQWKSEEQFAAAVSEAKRRELTPQKCAALG